MKIRTLVIILTAGLIVAGCGGGTSKPPGSPPVFPVKVTVVDGGTPIQNASVTFVYAEHPTAGTVGFTDANGVAEMRSIFGSYVGPGAPAGRCKVIVTKEPMLPDGVAKSSEEMDTMSESEVRAHQAQVARTLAALPREVPPSLSDIVTTPIEFEVMKGRNDFTIDVSQHR